MRAEDRYAVDGGCVGNLYPPGYILYRQHICDYRLIFCCNFIESNFQLVSDDFN